MSEPGRGAKLSNVAGERLAESREVLASEPLDCERLARLFEAAAPVERIALVESLDARAQARLWEAAAGRSVTIARIVPRELGPLVPVVCHGRNSLPAFTRFQKRFCRPADLGREELWGYNHQPTRWLAPLTGPGYFVAHDEPDGTVALDYRRIPSEVPAGWPPLQDNRRRLSRFVYHGLVDYLRSVSEHLLIGRATRGGRELDNWFALCREDPA